MAFGVSKRAGLECDFWGHFRAQGPAMTEGSG